ncbi:MAG TPA: nitrogenase component 1 [Bacillota bacterium]|nr:nitrogenase component 1 [Bacillota bacterium]
MYLFEFRLGRLGLKEVIEVNNTAFLEQVQNNVTVNACKLCTPLGACLAFKGIQGAFPYLHGSQGCATYIRRYMISHFKEPMDIGSSSISETGAIFGGGRNLHIGLLNVIRQYQPELIGVATTCLSETIGDDIRLLIKQFTAGAKEIALPPMVSVSTPSYSGTHLHGYRAAIRATVDSLALGGPRQEQINIIPGWVSPADLRHLKEILTDFQLNYVMVPDYSETLDGPNWTEYQKIPQGGTPVSQIRSMGRSRVTLELGRGIPGKESTGNLLWQKYKIPFYKEGLPIGLNETDHLLKKLTQIAGCDLPDKYREERGRLIDSYVDGHKYLFEKKAVVYGEPDLVVGLASFLTEIGVVPVLCATGIEDGSLGEIIGAMTPALKSRITVKEGVDFDQITELAKKLQPDLIIGNSKGYRLARQLEIPLIRVGFPIHDRLGGQRILTLGYRGAQFLFDEIVNAVIAQKQEQSPVGYSYM